MNAVVAWTLMTSGLLLAPVGMLCTVYALMIRHSFQIAGLELPLRQAAWLAITDVLGWLRLIERPPAHVEGLGARSMGGELQARRVRNPRRSSKPNTLPDVGAAPSTPMSTEHNPSKPKPAR